MEFKSRKIVKKKRSHKVKNNKRNTKKQRLMKGSGKEPNPHKLSQSISGLSIDLKNWMYENNKKNFYRK